MTVSCQKGSIEWAIPIIVVVKQGWLGVGCSRSVSSSSLRDSNLHLIANAATLWWCLWTIVFKVLISSWAFPSLGEILTIHELAHRVSGYDDKNDDGEQDQQSLIHEWVVIWWESYHKSFLIQAFFKEILNLVHAVLEHVLSIFDVLFKDTVLDADVVHLCKLQLI